MNDLLVGYLTTATRSHMRRLAEQLRVYIGKEHRLGADFGQYVDRAVEVVRFLPRDRDITIIRVLRGPRDTS